MILLNNVRLPLETDFNNLKPAVSKQLKISENEIISVSLYRKSVDARHKSDVHFCCSLLVSLKCEEQKVLKKNKNAVIYTAKKYNWIKSAVKPKLRPVVIGFGPSGMFCALTLARAGLNPIVFERGCDVDTRTADVENFFNTGKLNVNSNVQFGEGGAGTFSDGKLNTGIKDIRCRTVLETFVNFGADKKILTDAKPHIGTDVLKIIVKNVRNEIISLGGSINFSSKLEDICIKDGNLKSITVNGNCIECDRLVLATGHSARDTFKMLRDNGLLMIRKPFAVGVRAEHLQSDINKALYGDFSGHPSLLNADYKMNVHLKSGRGVYTFCMCPGGEVINASSEENGVAVNGMSNSKRNGVNANSAILVGVEPDDFDGDDVLAGCEFQRKIEQRAFEISCGAVPITTVGKFVFERQEKIEKVKPTVKPKTVFCDFYDIFPQFVCDSLKEGIKEFDKKISGFADESTILTAPETRSSSPVRVVRNEEYMAVGINGIYPSGEGAGYAGGIMSAAVDGMRVAESLIKNICEGQLQA